MSLFSSKSHQRGRRSSSRAPPLFSSFSLLVLAVATFLTIFVPSKVAASKTKNRAILKEKYGIDCGTHCTNAVVKLHEAKIEQEKCVRFFLLFAARIFLFLFVVFVVVVVLLSFFFFRVLREIREMEFLNGGKGTALLRADRGTICFRTLADERPYLYSLRVFLPRRQKTGD